MIIHMIWHELFFSYFLLFVYIVDLVTCFSGEECALVRIGSVWLIGS